MPQTLTKISGHKTNAVRERYDVFEVPQSKIGSNLIRVIVQAARQLDTRTEAKLREEIAVTLGRFQINGDFTLVTTGWRVVRRLRELGKDALASDLRAAVESVHDRMQTQD
jgi:hypothetical protein